MVEATQPRLSIMFVRHGEISRPAGIYLDEKDVHLTEMGQCQAKSVATRIKEFRPEVAAISPVPRCVESARFALASVACPLVYDDRLKERSFPPLYGLYFSEIAARFGSEMESHLRNQGELVSLPGVETIAAAQTRVLEAVRELAAKYRRAVVISHGGPYSWLCCYALGLDLSELRRFSLAYGCHSFFDLQQDQLTLLQNHSGCVPS